LPFTEEAQKKVAAYRALIGDSGATPGGFCPRHRHAGIDARSGGYPMEILHGPSRSTSPTRRTTSARVYLGDRIVPMADRIPGRNGHSSGTGGDTLVIETTHLVEQVDQRWHTAIRRASSSDTG
jgi:hypothetical protein